MEDSSVEKEKEIPQQTDIKCNDIDEEELKSDLRKYFPNYSDKQIQDLVQDTINSQCKIPVNKAIQSNDWVVNKKGEIDHKQLDEYTEQILKLTKNVSQEERKKWVDYLNNPNTHVSFKPTTGKMGNLQDDLSKSGLPKQIILNLLNQRIVTGKHVC